MPLGHKFDLITSQPSFSWLIWWRVEGKTAYEKRSLSEINGNKDGAINPCLLLVTIDNNLINTAVIDGTGITTSWKRASI